MRPCFARATSLLVLCATSALTCSEPTSERDACVPGLAIACPCLGGREGFRRCKVDRTFAACACEAPTEHDEASDASLDAGAQPEEGSLDAGAEPDESAAAADGGEKPSSAGTAGRAGNLAAPWTGPIASPVSSAAGSLVAALPCAPGILITTGKHIRLFARDASELAGWDTPATITAAVIEQDRLGVMDESGLTIFDVSRELRFQLRVPLEEPCTHAVLVSKQRVVCGNGNDTSRVYRVYDLTSGALDGTSRVFIYKGLPMRRVPGADRFVTVSNNSPTSLSLFEVSGDGQVLYVASTSFGAAVSEVYGFDADPATHVITQRGAQLDIATPECSEMPSSDAESRPVPCFVPDGGLGASVAGDLFLAMTNVAETLYALVDRAQATADVRDYWLLRVDVPSRSLVSQRALTLAPHVTIHNLAFDPFSERVLLATTALTNSQPPSTSNYQVMLLEVQ